LGDNGVKFNQPGTRKKLGRGQVKSYSGERKKTVRRERLAVKSDKVLAHAHQPLRFAGYSASTVCAGAIDPADGLMAAQECRVFWKIYN
jgi:hypothetical protein